ncbi:MAG TPA: Na/Pi symporter, partial [Firmicutes bacterium]|nr:Na/Pi symporter [Bacillota bacterium]
MIMQVATSASVAGSPSAMECVVAVMGLLGGLGVLLFGFKVLSESIEKLANDKLRGWFGKTSGTGRFAGLGIGLVTTTIIQSSSATTVMTVGFVNAGVMSLTMATAVIMGANIGTTITAQIAALSAFEFSAFLLPLAAIGVFMDMLSKNDKVKTIGMILGGLGLVFVALDVMSSSMAVFKSADWFANALQAITNPFLLILLGMGFTALVQSSSAVTSIIVALVSGGGVIIGDGGNSVLFLILGTNIGTCITAILSSIGANTNAKRAAFIHLMFNVF